MKTNPFELADRRFKNTDQTCIHVTYLGHDSVRQCLDTIKQTFRTLDYSDDYQSRLAFRLFRIRCSILFGLAQYSHDELQLLEQGRDLIAMADVLPGSRDMIARLNQQLKQLLDTPNTKLEWILRQDWEEASAAVFTPMAMGKTFGSQLIAEQKSQNLCVIHSVSELGDGKYSTLLVPGTMRYLSYALSMKLLHRGEFAKVHVLLYEGEFLDLKSRYSLPGSPLFPGLSSRSDIRIEYSLPPLQTDAERLLPADTDFGELEMRGGDPFARLLFFEDGSELHVRENECVHVWRSGSTDGLISVYPSQLMEGDYFVLEKGQRHDLLHPSDEDSGFRLELDATEVWRKPLNAMLLNHTPREIAFLMMETAYLDRGNPSASEVDTESAGLRNLQSNVTKWADGEVFGPGDISHMRALVNILVSSGVLEVHGSIDDAAETWFSALQNIRAGRRAAGLNLSRQRDELLKALLSKRTEIETVEELVLGNGMVISLHKLAIVGDPVQVVPDAFRKEPVRGTFRWLE
ncbi:hypothetical protein ACS8E9_14700 [Pseudomonas neustonica]|uniref:hypothetical protein n=1 Tax=Pseudomonas neustonica TaxID=2487346 RepID=UPI003F44C641